MAYDQLMQTYLGVGLLADRPAAPNVAPGVAAFYYGTDTAALYVWNAGTWHALAGPTLAGDSDVSIVAPTDGQVLTYVSAAAKWQNKAAAGGASGALTKLGEVIVGAGGQANIQFSNIDQSYRNLKIDYALRCDVAAANGQLVSIQFNGDAAANYDAVETGNYSTTAMGATATNSLTGGYFGYAASANEAAGLPVTYTCMIFDYARALWHKEWAGQGVSRLSGAAQCFAFHHSGVWHNTAAISSILLFPAAGNFVAGSVASLYGIS